MKTIAMVLAALATSLVTSAFAQDNLPAPVNSDDIERERWMAERYGQYAPQDGRVWRDERAWQYGGLHDRGYQDDRRNWSEWRDERLSRRWENRECWNPRARHYEGVRPGERQDDLDFARCRSRGRR